MIPNPSPVQLKFLGGAGTVTGSKILVRTERHSVLIDCGMFQGLKQLRLLNWEKLPLNYDELDAVILTHGHLDHCGALPMLVKNGYDGPIYATLPTRDVTEVILRDSARIQEEDALQANEGGYSRHHPARPQYTEEDVDRTMPLFETHDDNEWVIINEDFKFCFRKSGHILGSAMVELVCQGRKFVFSGDLGRRRPLLMEPPYLVKDADYVVLESTYGDRRHSEKSPYEELAEVVNLTYEKGGVLVIPSFAVERAQELLLLLNTLKQDKSIPPLPLYLDTPMGIDVTDLYLHHRDWHSLTDEECETMMRDVHVIRNFEHSLHVLDKKGPKIVIAGSGMVTGGRVLYYLEQLLGNSQNTILLVGFQAPGTRGNLLRSGSDELKIHGLYYKVHAEVRQIGSLSAHGDQADLLWWLEHFKKAPQQVFLNHGETQASEALRLKITDTKGWPVTIAQMGVTYDV
ncbi:MBL fold metallo-hydrolase RNA specificity domain-containing protein [Pontibacter mangrovi]|uniref:MBL fold metallo-hydrolase n=1 Tax=Pontibacter mangrovi TaxID=2589816 RepID=A0A501WBG0_9BACT|nr:MBL fold metallo-hydrolase [Pontibacter mangrovi]TPE45855.1 MBL fold metallo-hydrolase [Pontibacter mangrovi]